MALPVAQSYPVQYQENRLADGLTLVEIGAADEGVYAIESLIKAEPALG
jgi:hypothetical protein